MHPSIAVPDKMRLQYCISEGFLVLFQQSDILNLFEDKMKDYKSEHALLDRSVVRQDIKFVIMLRC